MYILKCDKCGRISEPQEGPWTTRGWDAFSVDRSHGSTGAKYILLCPECQTKLDLDAHRPHNEPTLADRLLAMLEEIASGAKKED